jgi:hypothetical protein
VFGSFSLLFSLSLSLSFSPSFLSPLLPSSSSVVCSSGGTVAMADEKKAKTRTPISLAGTFISSAFSASVAEVCTIPLDTAKVRLQLQGKALAGEVNVVPKYRGMVGTIATIAREEGTMSLWRGIVPGLHRQILFGGLRIGLYEPVCFSHLAFLPHHIPLFVSYVHNK